MPVADDLANFGKISCQCWQLFLSVVATFLVSGGKIEARKPA
jgi:hypothetical protein